MWSNETKIEFFNGGNMKLSDLNPVKNLWWKLKAQIQDILLILVICHEEWANIPAKICKFVASYSKRL